MESSKVKLPKEVIEAIQYYSKPYTKYGVLDCILGERSQVAVKAREILISTYGEGECWDVLMTALVNGYEIEETPEDKVRNMFNIITPEGWKFTGDANDPVYIERNAIRTTCILLGITVKGVND